MFIRPRLPSSHLDHAILIALLAYVNESTIHSTCELSHLVPSLLVESLLFYSMLRMHYAFHFWNCVSDIMAQVYLFVPKCDNGD